MNNKQNSPPTKAEVREIQKEDRDAKRRLMDKRSEAKYFLWNSLIIFNTLIFGATSVLFAINPNINIIFILILTTLSFSSISLLIKNYLITMQTYDEMYADGELFKEAQISGKKFDYGSCYENYKKKHAKTKTYQKISIYLSVLSAVTLLVFIIILSFTKAKRHETIIDKINTGKSSSIIIVPYHINPPQICL